MTTPAVEIARVPVTSKASQILPAMGDLTVTVYNEDITNVVWVSRQPAFPANAGNAAAVQPLTSSTFNARKALYAVTAGPTVTVSILGESENVNPSPAQIALQIAQSGLALETTQVGQNTNIPNNIAITGVPLLSKSTLLLSTLNNNLTGSGSSTSTAILPLNQIGYEIQIVVHETTSVGPTPTAGVEFQLEWSESSSGQIVGDERWNIFPSSFVSGLDQVVVGTGPTKGDRLQIFVTNNDAVQVNWGVVVLLNSRVYVRDDLRCPGPEGFNGVAGQTRSDSDLTSNLVGATLNTNQAAGNTDTKIIPLVAGRVKLHWDSASAAADCEMIIRAASISRVSGAGQTNIIFDKLTDGTGNGNEYFTLPRGQCTVAIKNGNAAAKTTRWVMTFEEY